MVIVSCGNISAKIGDFEDACIYTDTEGNLYIFRKNGKTVKILKNPKPVQITKSEGNSPRGETQIKHWRDKKKNNIGSNKPLTNTHSQKKKLGNAPKMKSWDPNTPLDDDLRRLMKEKQSLLAQEGYPEPNVEQSPLVPKGKVEINFNSQKPMVQSHDVMNPSANRINVQSDPLNKFGIQSLRIVPTEQHTPEDSPRVPPLIEEIPSDKDKNSSEDSNSEDYTSCSEEDFDMSKPMAIRTVTKLKPEMIPFIERKGNTSQPMTYEVHSGFASNDAMRWLRGGYELRKYGTMDITFIPINFLRDGVMDSPLIYAGPNSALTLRAKIWNKDKAAIYVPDWKPKGNRRFKLWRGAIVDFDLPNNVDVALFVTKILNTMSDLDPLTIPNTGFEIVASSLFNLDNLNYI